MTWVGTALGETAWEEVPWVAWIPAGQAELQAEAEGSSMAERQLRAHGHSLPAYLCLSKTVCRLWDFADALSRFRRKQHCEGDYAKQKFDEGLGPSSWSAAEESLLLLARWPMELVDFAEEGALTSWLRWHCARADFVSVAHKVTGPFVRRSRACIGSHRQPTPRDPPACNCSIRTIAKRTSALQQAVSDGTGLLRVVRGPLGQC